ncbi:MAG: adenosylhomocysteine nucleosidase [Bryobacterales bacterium]|jgi:uridine phosphorylase|nr:adenosylhomocysteine nucleosidase [Bryobacterales bacterium]
MSAPVLFVAADPREFAGWVSRWTDVRKMQLPVHWARAGKWRGREMIAIANGAGWERAAAAVRAAERPSAVYNIGFCGALTATLGIGDVFVATDVLSGGSRYPVGTPARSEGCSGTLISVARIAQTAAEKKKLSQTGAMVVEMEAAGVARASEELGVPFYCVRAVSDLFLEDFANDFNEFLMFDGRFDVLRLIIGAFHSPVARFGELIRLSRRTALASKNLGEFLADCSY